MGEDKKYEKISAGNLISKNIVNPNSKAKEFAKYSFWHYTQLSTVVTILKTKQFKISSLVGMNDLSEKNLYGDKAKYIHALSFSNSNTEKIPLWYLYAGISGKGAAIGITPAKMLEFCNSIETIKGEETGNILKRGKDFELQIGWIYYKANKKRINYRRRWYEMDDEDVDFFDRENYFIKDYPWEYEKEFRVVVINKIRTPENSFIVQIPDKIPEKLKVKLAPEVHSTDMSADENVIEELKTYTKNIEYSKLGIQMDLLRRNERDIETHILEKARKNPHDESIIKLYEELQRTQIDYRNFKYEGK